MGDVGPITIFAEGDLEKYRISSNIFLTIHDIGSSYQSWVQFNKLPDMLQIKQRALFLHISLPGQRPGAPDLTSFPSMQTMSLGLVNVLDYLRISQAVVLGEGAGANIALRFALHHPSRVQGIVLVNGSAGSGQNDPLSRIKDQIVKKKTHIKEDLNTGNVEKYLESYKSRGEVLSQLTVNKLTCDCLVITGNKSKMALEGEAIHGQIKPGQSSIIKIDDIVDPMEEAGDKVADSVVLFAQGLGLVPNAKRKSSRSSSTSSQEGLPASAGGKKLSMEEADIPNIRRLSLSDTKNV